MARLVVNEILKRRVSPSGTALAFVPGQNFVYELNDTATSILDLLKDPKTPEELHGLLAQSYEVEVDPEFQEDVRLIVDRFLEHNILVDLDVK